MTRDMTGNVISFRGVHVKRLVVLVLCCCVILYILSRTFKRKTPSVDSDELLSKDILNYHHNRMDSPPADITKGASLKFQNKQFILDGKPLTILSGAMHYFRVVPEYWKDRMLKMKACGLNTLETYVSWNLHAPSPGVYNFEGMLNIRRYLEIAKEVGLYVILRPGPYICSEWDFGGMPSWLLADPNMKVRSNYPKYVDAAEKFLNRLLPEVVSLQYSKGGPIIAVQVENEFGSYSRETDHLLFIKEVFQHNGLTELLVTSDNTEGLKRAPFHKHALPTVNFKEISKSKNAFGELRKLNENFPLMVMEYWSGWFDHWGQGHTTFAVKDFEENLKAILSAGSSVNFYMFHGGTNFGFMAGANFFDNYKPDVTSYDYDAPLDEAGNVTPKYNKARELILEYVLKKQGVTDLPPPPPNIPSANYGQVKIESYLPWRTMLELVDNTVKSPSPIYMEMLKLENNAGQSYGFIVYENQISRSGTLKIPGFVRDRAQILLKSYEIGTLDWSKKNPTVELQSVEEHTLLDIVVENLGRVNYILEGSDILNQQRKGISGDVLLGDEVLKDWKIYPLEFGSSYIDSLSHSPHWTPFEVQVNTPCMYKAQLDIPEEPKDTYVNMKGWMKGVVFVNGFNLGRYWNIGPQRTLYLPAPLLKKGSNEILIFELHKPVKEMIFQDKPDLG